MRVILNDSDLDEPTIGRSLAPPRLSLTRYGAWQCSQPIGTQIQDDQRVHQSDRIRYITNVVAAQVENFDSERQTNDTGAAPMTSPLDGLTCSMFEIDQAERRFDWTRDRSLSASTFERVDREIVSVDFRPG